MPFSTPLPFCSAARFSDSVTRRWLGSTSTAFSNGRKPLSSRGSGGRTRTTTCARGAGVWQAYVKVECQARSTASSLATERQAPGAAAAAGGAACGWQAGACRVSHLDRVLLADQGLALRGVRPHRSGLLLSRWRAVPRGPGHGARRLLWMS